MVELQPLAKEGVEQQRRCLNRDKQSFAPTGLALVHAKQNTSDISARPIRSV